MLIFIDEVIEEMWTASQNETTLPDVIGKMKEAKKQTESIIKRFDRYPHV